VLVMGGNCFGQDNPKSVNLQVGQTIIITVNYGSEIKWLDRIEASVFEGTSVPFPTDSKSQEIKLTGMGKGTGYLLVGLEGDKRKWVKVVVADPTPAIVVPPVPTPILSSELEGVTLPKVIRSDDPRLANIPTLGPSTPVPTVAPTIAPAPATPAVRVETPPPIQIAPAVQQYYTIPPQRAVNRRSLFGG
jgi:hypothetical protein